MKTAMQEMIQKLDDKSQNPHFDRQTLVILANLKREALNLLEKEKEQMIAFGKKMQLVQHVSYDDDITYCFNPEQYYNETYQNK